LCPGSIDLKPKVFKTLMAWLIDVHGKINILINNGGKIQNGSIIV